MLHAFIDESYIANRVYVTGALVVTDNQLRILSTGLDDVVWKTHKAHGIPTDIELHGQELFQRSGDWRCIEGKPQLAFAIYRNCLAKISQSGARAFMRGVRSDRLASRYVDPLPPHAVALQHLLERVNDYAGDLQEHVRIIADEVPDQAHHEERMSRYQNLGTPGWRSSRLENIEMPFRWEDSAQHRGLQAADLATFVYMRRRFHKETQPKVAAAVKGLRDALYPAMEHEWVWIP